MGIVDSGRDVKSLPDPLLATFTALVLSGLVPILLFNVGILGRDDNSIPLALIIVITGLRFAWIVGARTRHVHEMVVWLFAYFFLGVAPFIQQRLGYPGTTPNIDRSLVDQAAYISLVGILALMIGSYWASKKKSLPTEHGIEHPVNEKRVYVLAIATLLLALVYIAQVGLTALFASRTTASLARQESFGDDPLGSVLRASASMGLLVAFVGLMHIRKIRRVKGLRSPRMLTLLVLVTLVICVNPISSARYTFGTVALAVLATIGAYATVRRFRAVALGSVVGLVALFPVLDTFRRSLDAQVEFESPLISLTSGDFDAFAQIVNTVEYLQIHDIAWGRQLLGVFLFWVPRPLWPDKPIDTGTMLAQFKGYTFENLSASMWSELMINFGWVGLIVGMIALGFLFRRLDVRAEAALRLSKMPPVLGCIVPFYLLIVLRGSLLQAMANLAVILLFGWFITSRTHRRRSTSVSRPLRSSASSRV